MLDDDVLTAVTIMFQLTEAEVELKNMDPPCILDSNLLVTMWICRQKFVK